MKSTVRFKTLIKLKNQMLISLMIVAFTPLLLADNSYRVFKNEAGKSLVGKVLQVNPSTVTLKHENGRTITTDPKFFSQKDQQYFKNWKLKELAMSGSLIKVDCNKKMDKLGSKRYGTDNALKVTTFEGYYTIEIENKTDKPLDQLKLEYKLYSSEENVAKKNRHDITKTQIDGSTFLSLASYKTAQIKTKTIQLTESKLGGGYQFEGGGDVNTTAKIEGIWLRIYLKDSNLLLYEIASPKSLMEKEDW